MIRRLLSLLDARASLYWQRRAEEATARAVEAERWALVMRQELLAREDDVSELVRRAAIAEAETRRIVAEVQRDGVAA